MNQLLTAFICLTLVTVNAFAQRGKDGSRTITGTEIVNEYTFLTADITAGDQNIQVNNSALNSNGRFASTLQAGDLIYIYQAQGATIDGSQNKSINWGTIVNYNNAGNNEYLEVASVAGNEISFTCGAQNSYDSAGNTVIVRVPRFADLFVPAGVTLTGSTWDGSIGGLLIVEVEGDVTVNGIVEMNEKGFRGTPSTNNPGTQAGARNEYATTMAQNAGLKGEGIAGYHTEYDLLNGRYGQGAAANAGGGGASVDAGGGGGANAGNVALYTGTGVPDISNNNYIAAWENEAVGFSTLQSSGGGRGGYCKSDRTADLFNDPLDDYGAWGSDGRRNDACGAGGRPLDYSTGKLFLGGGGGQGHGNDQDKSAGGSGGGLIFFTVYGIIDGNGSIAANGAFGEEGGMSTGFFGFNPDGAGGAGAGGTIVVDAQDISSLLSMNAKGGEGGAIVNATFNTALLTGPGGGGGGGYIRTSVPSTNIDVSGGSNGDMLSGLTLDRFEPNGATFGASGVSEVKSFTPIVLSAINDTICEGEDGLVSISVLNKPLGEQVNWYNAYESLSPVFVGDDYVISNLTSDTVIYAGICSGTYKIPVTIKVNNASPNGIVEDTVTVCTGNNVVLNGFGGNEYNWYASNDLVSSTQSAVSFSATVSQWVYASISINGDCPNIDSAFVQIASDFTIDLGQDVTICSGDSVVLDAGLGVNYSWAPNQNISSLNNQTATVSPFDTIKYYVTVDDGAGCAGTDSIIVNVLPAIQIQVPEFQELCKDQVAALTATSSGGSDSGVTYLWDEGVYVGPTQNLSWSQNGSMEVKVLDNTYGCSDSASFGIKVNSVEASFTYEDTCQLSTVLFTNTSIVTGDSSTLTWLANNSTPFDGEYLFPDTGLQRVSLIVTDELGCTDTAIKIISIAALPIATIVINPDTICAGDSLVYSNSRLSGEYIWEWDFTTSNSTTSNGTVGFEQSGVYPIEFVLTDVNGCSRSASDTVVVLANPIADFDLEEPVNIGDSIIGINLSLGGQQFEWRNGTAVISSDFNLGLVASEIGEFCYTLGVTEQVGCKDTIRNCITVGGLPLQLPTIFTPNNDGINDLYTIQNSNDKTVTIEVLNRWGLTVYKSDDYQNNWDGTDQDGNELAAGTYFIKVTDSNASSNSIVNGFLYLAR